MLVLSHWPLCLYRSSYRSSSSPDENSRKQESEWKEKAKVELEEWHARQNEQLEKTKSNNRYWLHRGVETTCQVQWKMIITPYQISKSSGTWHFYWRECGSDSADHAHVFWSCPYVQPFWKGVGSLISEILDLDTDFSFNVLYLGHIPQGLNKSDTYLLKIFMVASKKTLTKSWLQKNPPTIATLIKIINSIRLMEKMTFTLRLQKTSKREGGCILEKMGLLPSN